MNVAPDVGLGGIYEEEMNAAHFPVVEFDDQVVFTIAHVQKTVPAIGIHGLSAVWVAAVEMVENHLEGKGTESGLTFLLDDQISEQRMSTSDLAKRRASTEGE
jgi:hypothetical protein